MGKGTLVTSIYSVSSFVNLKKSNISIIKSILLLLGAVVAV
jgi:hypothetical protein